MIPFRDNLENNINGILYVANRFDSLAIKKLESR